MLLVIAGLGRHSCLMGSRGCKHYWKAASQIVLVMRNWGTFNDHSSKKFNYYSILYCSIYHEGTVSSVTTIEFFQQVLTFFICSLVYVLGSKQYGSRSRLLHRGQKKCLHPWSKVDWSAFEYSKTCLKRPIKRRLKIGFQDRFSLNAGQKYCRMLQEEHSAIPSTFIKLSFVIKTVFLSIFEWPFKTGFTVYATDLKAEYIFRTKIFWRDKG